MSCFCVTNGPTYNLNATRMEACTLKSLSCWQKLCCRQPLGVDFDASYIISLAITLPATLACFICALALALIRDDACR